MPLPKVKEGDRERHSIEQVGMFSLVFNNEKKVILWLENDNETIRIGTYKHFGSARTKMLKVARKMLHKKISLLTAELYSCTKSYDKLF
jgi:hypothetical protein